MVRAELIAHAFAMQYLAREPFPLNLERVAQAIETKLDIDIYLHYMELPMRQAANLVMGKRTALISINKKHPAHVQRMGVAHEFGHILLEHEIGNPDPWVSEHQWESDTANYFAAALLMPSWVLSWLIRKYHDSLELLLRKTVEYCDIGLESAARRLADADILPCLYALIDPGAGKRIWEYHSRSVYLDHDAFRGFLVKNFESPRHKWRETDLDIMGYPFRTEIKQLGPRYLITCHPFMARQQAL